jgi:hypothetical protein
MTCCRILALSRAKMKRFASLLIYLPLSNSVALARPSGSAGLRDINLSSLISDVAINTTGAADVIRSPSHSMTSGRTSLIVSLFLPYCFGETDLYLYRWQCSHAKHLLSRLARVSCGELPVPGQRHRGSND